MSEQVIRKKVSRYQNRSEDGTVSLISEGKTMKRNIHEDEKTVHSLNKH